MVAWLELGMEMLLRFFCDQQALSCQAAQQIRSRFRSTLWALAVQQARQIQQDRPTHIFLRKFHSLRDCGQLVVVPRSCAHPPERCVGYEDDTYYYLHTDLVHRAVRRLCEEQGESFSISARELLRALAEEQLLSPGSGQNTKPVRIGQKTMRLMCLRKDQLDSALDGGWS